MYTRAGDLPFLPSDVVTPCAEYDHVFLAAGDVEDARDVAHAVMLCHSCPVMAACRLFALRTNQEWGVWGGLTAKQRIAHRKNLRTVRLVAS